MNPREVLDLRVHPVVQLHVRIHLLQKVSNGYQYEEKILELTNGQKFRVQNSKLTAITTFRGRETKAAYSGLSVQASRLRAVDSTLLHLTSRSSGLLARELKRRQVRTSVARSAGEDKFSKIEIQTSSGTESG